MKTYTVNVTLFELWEAERIGRKNPAKAGYRPHVVVDFPDGINGQQERDADYLGVEFLDDLNFGENKNVRFKAVYDSVCYDALKPKASFEIREGRRLAGTGEVLYQT